MVEGAGQRKGTVPSDIAGELQKKAQGSFASPRQLIQDEGCSKDKN